MSERVEAKIVFILEHEIRLAAKALRVFHAVHNNPDSSEDARVSSTLIAIQAASAALWHADRDDYAIMLTSAEHIFGARRKQKERPRDRRDRDGRAAEVTT